jgi:hypothetical protein
MVFLLWLYLSCTLSRLASPKFDSSANLFLKIFFPALVGSYSMLFDRPLAPPASRSKPSLLDLSTRASHESIPDLNVFFARPTATLEAPAQNLQV